MFGLLGKDVLWHVFHETHWFCVRLEEHVIPVTGMSSELMVPPLRKTRGSGASTWSCPDRMPAGSMVNTGLLIGWRQSDIRKKQHVDNFLNKFCRNALFPPCGNVALLNN